MLGFGRLALLTLLWGCLGCATTLHRGLPTEALVADATLAAETRTSEMLKALPPARSVVTLSVYQFDDQTGQNKPGEVPNYSRAVTQGGLAILKQALLDAGGQSWFRVLERGGLQNLLQERQLIRSMREQYAGPEGQRLPQLAPLLYSGVILEGGIIAYESNLATGGAGARYLGIGADAQYRRDMVTVALQAVSVSTGEVLAAVSTSKTILSTATRGGAYYFVSFDRLLEAEAGVTTNEPPQLAVRQAIEMAVYALVMEGYQKGLWQFADPAVGARAHQGYVDRFQRSRPGRPEELETAAEIGQTAAPSQQVAQSPPPAAVTAVALAPAVTQRAAAAPAAQKSPAPRDPAATAADNVPRGWYVQVLAVRAFGPDEHSILSELERRQMPVTIQRALLGTTQYYRIMVGPYASQSQAEAGRAKLAELSSDPRNHLLRRVYVIARI